MLTKQFIPDTFYDNLVPRPDQMDPLVGEQSLCTVAVVITPARVKAGSKKERQKTTQGEFRSVLVLVQQTRLVLPQSEQK